MFGLHSNKHADLKWYTGEIGNIERSAFSSSSVSYFYACRTGNTFNGTDFAQAWADVTGGTTYAYSGALGITGVGKSDYEDIYGNLVQRQLYDKGLYGMLSDEYVNFMINRGPIEARPGEAWSLPHAGTLSVMTTYYPGGAPDPAPGPGP